MAKQNFLNGGYIGKLGNTVGQRWKDKKIIRTYVVPANPNTPAQQTARQQFAIANKLAQQAMIINGHTGVWDTSTKPEYSQRVGQAMKRLRLGYSEQDSLPLYPEGQAPAIGLTLTNVIYDDMAEKYTFYTQGFGINNPLATEVTFFTPLNYAGGQYQENIVHGTVDSQTGTFEIDVSANNQTDSQVARALFQNAMQLGFCAIKATFYDALGAVLPNLSIARRFKVTGKLYDFDESLPMLDSTQKVDFTQAFSQNNIQGSISPFQTAGFPIVYKVSVENQYYGGLIAETVESGFVTMNANQDTTFVIPVTPASGNLQETTSTTYGLTVGATQPQITKDISTEAYAAPVNQLAITDIAFAGNTITFNVDQNLNDVGATGGTATITYKDLTKWPTMDNSTIAGAITIAPAGTSFSITNADVPNLGEIILGQLQMEFTQANGQAIAGLAPDVTTSVAGKYYYSDLADKLSITQATTMLSGKAIAGTVKASIKATAYPGQTAVYQNAMKVTYKAGNSEVLLVPGVRNAINVDTPITATTVNNVGSEITAIEAITLAVLTGSTTNNTGWESSTATVQPNVTLGTLTYNKDTLTLSISKPTNQPAYLTRMGGTWKAWESSIKGIAEDDIPVKEMNASNAYVLDVSVLGADSTEKGAPLFINPAFFYEDGSECTTTALTVNTQVSLRAGLVAPYSLYQNKPFATASLNTTASTAVKFTANANVFPTAQTQLLPAVGEFLDNGGDSILEGISGASSTSATQATFAAGDVYISNAGVQIAQSGYLIFWYISDGKVYLVTQN